MGFFVSREPDFVVDVGLLENEARSLLKVGDHAAGEAEIADKVGFEARDVVRLFVDPNYAGQLVGKFFDEFVRFEFRVGLEIED